MKAQIAVGDLVKHRVAFLRSTGWYTNVPKNGKVLALTEWGDSWLATVQWCDDEEPMRINLFNLIHYDQLDPT